MCCQKDHGGNAHALEAETYPQDETRYCLCRGAGKGKAETLSEAQCCGAASGPDGLCDRCRDNCVISPNPKFQACDAAVWIGNGSQVTILGRTSSPVGWLYEIKDADGGHFAEVPEDALTEAYTGRHRED